MDVHTPGARCRDTIPQPLAHQVKSPAPDEMYPLARPFVPARSLHGVPQDVLLIIMHHLEDDPSDLVLLALTCHHLYDEVLERYAINCPHGILNEVIVSPRYHAGPLPILGFFGASSDLMMYGRYRNFMDRIAKWMPRGYRLCGRCGKCYVARRKGTWNGWCAKCDRAMNEVWKRWERK